MTPSHRFALDIAINSVSCDVQINDIPVVKSYSGDRLDVRMPVSDFILPRHNTVTIRTMVDRSAGGKSSTQATARLLATPYDQSDWRPLLSVRTIALAGANGETTLEPESSLLGPVSPQSSTYDSDILLLENSRSIELHATIPSWAWESSATISDSPETRLSLVRWYEKLHTTLAEQRMDIIAGLLREKSSELAIAHRITPEAASFEIGLERTATNPEVQLSPVAWQDLRMEIAGHGRLARLYHPRSGAVIVFENALKIFHTFDFWLRRDGANWILAR